jgi:hypothetical protein
MMKPFGVVSIAFFVFLLVFGIGCSSPTKVDISKLGPPLSAGELAEIHNTRVEPIGSLWARISVRAKGRYDDGEKYEEQGEGHLQIVKPSNISMTIGKLGETYFVFGSNATEYWSFNLSDKDHKVALLGMLDQVTPEKASTLGLPVHPGELIALTGLMPIDLARAGGTRWADDGKSVGVSMPSHWGSVTLWINPKSGLVIQTQAYNHDGQLVATANLSRYKDAIIKGQRPVLVPGKVEITTPGDDGLIRIELSEPSNKPIRSIVFTPKKLIHRYRIDETIDLDAAFEQPARSPQSPPQQDGDS